MNIKDFCDLNNIRWQPIEFRNISQNKAPLRVTDSRGKSWTPKTSDYYGPNQISEEELEYRQMYYPNQNYAHIILDTSTIQQVDFDSAECLQNESDPVVCMINGQTAPWYSSATKQLPHVFVRLENSRSHGKRHVAAHSNKIDVLNGQWSIAGVRELVANPGAQIPNLPISYIRGPASTNNSASAPPVQVNLNDVDRLLEMLAPHRVSSYASWIDVGIALKNSGPEEEMKSRWIRWSSQNPLTPADVAAGDTHETICERKWATFVRGPLMSIGSIKHWAKEDSPHMYHILFGSNEQYQQPAPGNLSRADSASTVTGPTSEIVSTTTDFDIATQIHAVYKDRYATVSVPGGKFEWYEFKNHRWVEIGMTPVSLLQNISTDICKMIQIEIEGLQANANATLEQMCESAGIRSVDPRMARIFNINGPVNDLAKLHNRLRTQSAKVNIVRECAVLFSDSEFLNRLDERHNLIGFNNGVFDLDLMQFRPGRPDDYVSYSTGYDYTGVVDETVRAEILKFKRDIMSSEEMAEYLMTSEAYALHGDTWIQNMFVHSGRGGNGKSVNGILMRKTFGDYFYAPDISMFTGRKSGMNGGSSSELAKAKGRRLLMSTEPEAGDTLQAARIKYYTGGEMIQARALYKLPIEFLPQFTIHLQMNQLPNLSNFDGGIARRLKIVPYTFQFTDNPTLPHQKQMDRTLVSRFGTDTYSQQCMLILLEYYDKYLRGHRDIKYPAEATEYTDEYMAEEDFVGTFVQSCCQVTNLRADKVTGSELYAHFKASPHGRGDISIALFGRKLRELGIDKVRTRKGVIYRGVKIVHESDAFLGGNDGDDDDDV